MCDFKATTRSCFMEGNNKEPLRYLLRVFLSGLGFCCGESHLIIHESSFHRRETQRAGGAAPPVGENGTGNSAISSYIQATTGSVFLSFSCLSCHAVNI